jgi:2-C-methyl-D-erythritol 2,4-cyclodiphosphate synthase
MQKVLAEIMQVEEEDISIKATTGERMGFVGRKEGICAYVVALIYKD